MPAILLFALLLASAAGPTPQARIERLEESLYAPCCWQETVKTHRSEIALTMKLEIARMVGEGRSDRAILDVYKQRYGKRILIEPEGQAWWVALVVPVAAGILGLCTVALLIRRWRIARPVPASSGQPAPDLPDEF